MLISWVIRNFSRRIKIGNFLLSFGNFLRGLENFLGSFRNLPRSLGIIKVTFALGTFFYDGWIGGRYRGEITSNIPLREMLFFRAAFW